MTFHILVYCATLLLLLAAAPGCGTSGQNGSEQGVVINSGTPGESADSVSHLNLNRPNVEQAIEIAANETPRFVKVEVTEVTNPKKHAVTFEVRYRQAVANAEIYLGSFSLYPSDNPGKFLVATQGKVKGRGAIKLTLVTPDKTDKSDVINVAVRIGLQP